MKLRINVPEAMTVWDTVTVRAIEDWQILRNDQEIANREEEFLVCDWIEDPFINAKFCPLCEHELLRSYDCTGSGLVEIEWGLWHCAYCAYWQHWQLEQDHTETPSIREWVALMSKAREFDGAIPDGCSQELASLIRRRPSIWNSLDPKGLEVLVADIYRANFADAEVLHVGQPNDGGVDVLFIESGGKQWLIQVKRRSRKSSAESVNTVRNLLGSLVVEGVPQGIVVSTADHFTYQAYRAANQASSQGYLVKLLDRGKIDRMLTPLLPSRPWAEALAKYIDEVSVRERLEEGLKKIG